MTPLCRLFSHVDFRIGRALFNVLAGSRRQALGPKDVDKIDQSRRWLYGVAACFIGAFASPGATVLMLPASAGAVPLPWTSFVGVLAPLPLHVGDIRRSWRSEDSSPTTGWVTVRVEQPSTGLRAIMQHVHSQLRMVGSKHGRGPLLKLECVATHWALPQTLVSAHRDFARSVLKDSREDPTVVDLRSTQSTTNTWFS